MTQGSRCSNPGLQLANAFGVQASFAFFRITFRMSHEPLVRNR